MSIRRRMTGTIVAAILILLGLAGAVLYGYIQKELTQRFDESLLAKAKALASLLHQRGESNAVKVEFDFSDNVMPEFNKGASAEYFELWSNGGKRVERSNSLEESDLPVSLAILETPQFVNLQLSDGRPGRSVVMSARPVQEDEDQGNGNDNGPASWKGRLPQPYLLAVARERTTLNGTLQTIAVAGVGGVLGLAAVVGLLVPWLIAKNLKPLDTMAIQASRIDANALETRFPVTTMPAELQPICGRLNDSMERLQLAFARERRFSADVAHELRTPIAELRLLSELAVKFPRGDSTDRAFQDALDIARQMEMIVETLLQMMASEAAATPEQLEPTELSLIADQAWRVLQDDAAAKQITWHRELVGAEASVPSNPTILRCIFSNLVSNAVEYSPAGAVIECRFETLADRMKVQIINPAQNLSAVDLPHLVEPFWRKDAARSGTRHAGLGLALVNCYARRLRIGVQMEILRPGVFQVTLEIPRGERLE